MSVDNISTPGPRFTTKEQAEGWALDLVTNVREARARVDLEPSAAEQRKWHHKLLVRYGAAKGALDALYRCGQLSDTFYSTCCEQALMALAVKVTDIPEGGLHG